MNGETYQIDFNINKYVVHEIIDHWDPIGMKVGGNRDIKHLINSKVYQTCTKDSTIIITHLAKKMLVKDGLYNYVIGQIKSKNILKNI